MNILVTGGAGFIGSHLCEKLVSLDNKVIVIDNLDDYYSPSIKLNNIEQLQKNNNFKFYKENINDHEAIKNILKDNNIELVCHLAAKVGVRNSINNPFLYNETNINGTLNILELCRELNIKKLIFASSSSVYGNSKKIPFSENDPAMQPISPYAATKRAGELLCYTYHQLYNFDITCLRFFTVYGPGQRPDMAISKFTDLIYNGKPITMYGDGAMERDFTYIDDIIQGIFGAINKINGYNIYNLGESSSIKLIDLIKLISKTLGVEAIIEKKPVPPGDVSKTYADISKSKSELDYDPSVNIEDGIEKFVNWYINQKR